VLRAHRIFDFIKIDYYFQAEETGGYFEDVLKILEKNPWLKESLPWGKLSKYTDLEACESDDGPIMWTCPGK
jgi:hypothetical protein